MTNPKKIISWLCLISLLFGSCKKELGSDFDKIIGKWKWTKTTHHWDDIFDHHTHIETSATSSTVSDIYEIEFVKKGKVITYVNGKIKDKYRVKDSHGAFESLFNYWGFTIELNGKKTIHPTYYVSGDSITISEFFPKTKSDFGISESSTGDEIYNCFVRE